MIVCFKLASNSANVFRFAVKAVLTHHSRQTPADATRHGSWHQQMSIYLDSRHDVQQDVVSQKLIRFTNERRTGAYRHRFGWDFANEIC